ncbi:hypothetical protein CC85DRAFT_173571 [Cutaneotrichosporon oleaginosum]|uniref:Uncharacterized protein n=1 Tax=Cutaneotrichosporon oleaginosum TaxID=879819 RepID=A0A0J0XVP0_9TREE|nr:uncharacterized protein CC85DRAFT_173571 [Cutaneotrichosporon oleaginosum]KLT45150.1 hypothetical protein CC85DRAFT_173571 [Cutaneotrichosporon oleaginosum]TXT09830.1 hypothetical protein COLE_03764 [Cutaneotrichosporon oleaginosum]
MTPEMHANAFTQKHSITARASGFIVLGPVSSTSKSGERPGQMTDWRDIVNAIQDMAALHQMRQAQAAAERTGDPSFGPAESGYQPTYMREKLPTMPIRDPLTLIEATGKAGSAVKAFIEAENSQNRLEKEDAVMSEGVTLASEVASEDKRDSGAGDKGEVQPPYPFQSIRPGWGEYNPIGPDHYMMPLPGLPTTVPGRINLGPRAEALSKTPWQFSSAEHWHHMSETGVPAARDDEQTTVGAYIHASTMMTRP